jgi:hypothetical protein
MVFAKICVITKFCEISLIRENGKKHFRDNPTQLDNIKMTTSTFLLLVYFLHDYTSAPCPAI